MKQRVHGHLHRLQNCYSPHGETKPTVNYNSQFAKWASWCKQRNRNPIVVPVEDVVNFLAQLFKRYKYRSLFSYIIISSDTVLDMYSTF